MHRSVRQPDWFPTGLSAPQDVVEHSLPRRALPTDDGSPAVPVAVAVAVLTIVAVVLVLMDVPGQCRAVLVAAALLTAPGLAVLPRIKIDRWAQAGIVVVSSVVLGVLVAMAQVWSGWWHPTLVGSVGLALSAGLIAVRHVRLRPPAMGVADPPRSAPPGERRSYSGRFDRPVLVAALVLAAAGSTWVVSLTLTSAGSLGPWGLLAALPWLWFLSLGAVVGVLIWGLLFQRSLPDGWMAAHCALLVLMLYGTATFVATTPRLPWIYKHIAVTRYLGLNGTVDRDIDLYQRWPGFFAWTGQMAELIGQPNPVHWAGLAEPFFALIDALLVLAVVRAITRNRGCYWMATVLFCLGNWVNQNYFAPQALGYTLYLFIALLLLSTVSSSPFRLGRWMEHLLGRLAPAPAEHDAPSPVRRGAWIVVAIVLAFAVVVASHQLTPFLTLVIIAPLFLLGYFRPTWLVLALGILAVAYLVPNLAFIEARYGIISSFDPLANAAYSSIDRTKKPFSEFWSSRATYGTSGMLYLAAFVGLARRIRVQQVRSALLVAWMMLSPALILAVQSYGGEGRLRVYLFSLPWCAIAASWAFWPGDRLPTRKLRVVAATMILLLATLFPVTYLLTEQTLQVPASEVDAAEWIDSNAGPGDVLLAFTPMYPRLIGPHYDDLIGNVDVSQYAGFYVDNLTRRDLVRIGSELREGMPHKRLLVVFSDQQSDYAAQHKLYEPGELARLELQVRMAAGDAQVYDRAGVRIYQLR